MSGHRPEYDVAAVTRCIAHTALDRDVTEAKAQFFGLTGGIFLATEALMRIAELSSSGEHTDIAEAALAALDRRPAVSAVTQHEQP